ncbi:hypothetical protein KAR91_55320 [Candidatus Pacearchaeota archaeon]|nr:hypothetical protein [Candidatus Pacearchaeota archaeon]
MKPTKRAIEMDEIIKQMEDIYHFMNIPNLIFNRIYSIFCRWEFSEYRHMWE